MTADKPKRIRIRKPEVPGRRRSAVALGTDTHASSFWPDDPMLLYIFDEKDPLYDEAVEDEVTDADVLDVALHGAITPVILRRRGDKYVVVDGNQRCKRALIVNDIVGQRAYTGKIKAVHAAIKRIKASDLAKRIMEECPDGVKVLGVGRNHGDDGRALEEKTSANAFRKPADNADRAARRAQQLASLGRAPADIATAMKTTPNTVRRWLKRVAGDAPVERKKGIRGASPRPKAKVVDAFATLVIAKGTAREQAIMKFMTGVGSDPSKMFEG